MDFPRRVFDGEGVKADVDFGPTLMLNRNRCILCTRCVRFMREVDGDAQIGIVDRGNGSEIATFQEQGVHSLLSGNLMDVCPVGAITTRDYRFKSRPWDNPNAVDTICTLCSKGCNTTAWIKAKPEWAKGSRLVRITPRFNPEVNGYWMCDIGRFDYHWVEGERRLQQPLVRARRHRTDAGDLGRRAAAPSTNASTARRRPRGGALPGLRARVARRAVRAARGSSGKHRRRARCTWRHREKPQPANTKFKVPAVDAPNVRGARDLGFAGQQPDGAADLAASRPTSRPAASRRSTCSIPGPDGSIGDTRLDPRRAQGRHDLRLLIVQGVLLTPLADAADIVLPGCAFVEKDATYTNMTGRLQAAVARHSASRRRRRGLADPHRSSASLRHAVSYASAEAVRAAIARDDSSAIPGYAELATLVVRAPDVRAPLAAGVEPVGALEVGLHVPGPAAGEVRRRVRPDSTGGRHSAQRSEVACAGCSCCSSGRRRRARCRRAGDPGDRRAACRRVRRKGGDTVRRRCRSPFPRAFTSNPISRAIRR